MKKYTSLLLAFLAFYTYSTDTGKKFALCDYNEIATDAQAIINILKDNHPGIHNAEDNLFLTVFQKSSDLIISLQKDLSYEEGFAKIQTWIHSFDDPHLRITKITSVNPHQIIQKSDAFDLLAWTPNTVYIKIPTFQPSLKEQDQLKKIIMSMPTIQNAKNIVFDVRGNGGGSSFWAQKITNALFGSEYMEQRQYLYEKDTEIDWRASKNNVLYIQHCRSIIEQQFGKDSTEYAMTNQICDELEKAYVNNKLFFTQQLKDNYDEFQITQKVTSLCQANLFILIDDQCASATLSFIDQLKSLDNNCTLIGLPTAYDTEYMECRSELLPSGKARLTLPIKMYRNRNRKSRQPYFSDIHYNLDEKNEFELKQWFLNSLIN